MSENKSETVEVVDKCINNNHQVDEDDNSDGDYDDYDDEEVEVQKE